MPASLGQRSYDDVRRVKTLSALFGKTPKWDQKYFIGPVEKVVRKKLYRGLTVWQSESARSEESDVISSERSYEQQQAKNFSGVEANPDVSPLTALLSALTASHERWWLYSFAPTHGLYYHQYKYVRKRLRPSHRGARLSTPFTAIHEKKSPMTDSFWTLTRAL